jgi:hypothetical protein
VLLVALLLSSVLGVSLASYIALNTQSLKLANRSFYLAEAVNMAEGCLEEVVWSFNQSLEENAAAWDGWDRSDGLTARRTFTDFTLSGNATGSVKVWIERFNPPVGMQPKAVAFASITLPGGQGVVTKMVELRVRRRAHFASGLVAKETLTFSGQNTSVDSWVSDPDEDASTPPLPYSTALRRDKGSIAGVSINSQLSVGNADIWGTACVGASASSAISVGSQGLIGPFGTTTGSVNPESVTRDFAVNLEAVIMPAGGTIVESIGATIGTADTKTMWRAPCITDSLTVYGDVTLVLTAGPGALAIDLTGQESITLAEGSKLTIYSEGDMKVLGNGLFNNNTTPDTFQLWGASTSAIPQDIQLTINASLKGIAYAPNSNIKINGNGDMMGSYVAKNINVTGNAAFHYDESLARLGETTPYSLFRWRELVSAADRSVHSAAFATF